MDDEKFDGRQRYSRDREIEARLEELFRSRDITPLEAVNHFPLFARRTHLKKFLAHWELFRRTIELPGDIVELGVFRGLSLMTFANFLEVVNVGDRTKKAWGFDNWSGFAGLAPEDGPALERMHKQEGDFSPKDYFDELQEVLAIFDMDRFVGWKKRVELVVGDVETTVPEFVEKNPGLRISLLHFDVDLYRPTKVGLECFYDRVVRGGVVIFDEYGILEWSGESQAVDEFFAARDVQIQKFPWQGAPGGYIVKP